MWPFVAVVLLQAGLAGFSLYTLSTVRAYVGGESFWSKGQKDAIYYLGLYVDSGDETYFREYEKAIAVPLADRTARLALDQPSLDAEKAARGFLGGGNHPEDVGGLIWLYRTFGEVAYLKRSIEAWAAGDEAILALVSLADGIHDRVQLGRVDRQTKDGWRADIHEINTHIAVLSRAFSQSLGDGSRFILNALLAANIFTAMALIAIGIWRTRNVFLQRAAFETALNVEKERAAITLASIGQAVFTTDVIGRLDYMNAAAEGLAGLTGGEAIGRQLNALFKLEDVASKADRPDIVDGLAKGLAVGAGIPWSLVRNDGTRVAVSLNGAPLSADGAAAGAVIVLHDMTREQEYIAQLSWQASHDALTNLGNRREFEARAADALRNLSDGGAGFALLFLDLDQFKIVNDTGGHAAGDQLLRQLANLLRQQLPAADMLARLGGDEFGVIMAQCDADAAWAASEALRQTVENMAFTWSGRSFVITVSVGLVHVSDASATLEETLRAADVACYLAKEKGRNRVQSHSTSDLDLLRKFGEMAWVQRIRDALDEDRFFLDAQEIRPLQGDRQGRHVEVLLRLRDEAGHVVPPTTFIPAAERYGLMPLVDRWVVRRTFETLARHAALKTDPISTCAINLSGATLGDPGFTDFLAEQFGDHGIVPSAICFEITETTAISNLESATRFIETLQRIGCRFSLDDFGAGMSSFTYLKTLPVDFVKIDGTFVRDILRDPIDRAMVETIDRIGKLMGKLTIAEFVESDEIARCLQDMGVDYAQGFGVARPVLFEAKINQTRDRLGGARRAVA